MIRVEKPDKNAGGYNGRKGEDRECPLNLERKSKKEKRKMYHYAMICIAGCNVNLYGNCKLRRTGAER